MLLKAGIRSFDDRRVRIEAREPSRSNTLVAMLGRSSVSGPARSIFTSLSAELPCREAAVSGQAPPIWALPGVDRSSGLWAIEAAAFPGRVAQWLGAVSRPPTAARQLRLLTGFPDPVFCRGLSTPQPKITGLPPIWVAASYSAIGNFVLLANPDAGPSGRE